MSNSMAAPSGSNLSLEKGRDSSYYFPPERSSNWQNHFEVQSPKSKVQSRVPTRGGASMDNSSRGGPIQNRHWTLDFRLQTSDFRLQTSDFRLQTSDFRLWTYSMSVPLPPVL